MDFEIVVKCDGDTIARISPASMADAMGRQMLLAEIREAIDNHESHAVDAFDGTSPHCPLCKRQMRWSRPDRAHVCRLCDA